MVIFAKKEKEEQFKGLDSGCGAVTDCTIKKDVQGGPYCQGEI